MSVPVSDRFPLNSRVLRVFLIVCQLFGVSPIRVKVNDSNKRKSKVDWWSRMIFVGHLCWCLAILSLVSYCMLEHYGVFLTTAIAPIMQIMSVSEYIFNIMNCVLIIFGANYQRRWQSIYFQQINTLDLRLHYPAAEANSDVHRFLRIVFMVCGLFMVCVVGIMIVFNESNYFGLFLTLGTYVVTNLIISLALLQYLLLIFLVQQRYKRLVNGLKKLSLTETVNHLPSNNELLRNIFVVEMQTVGRRMRSPSKGNPDAIRQRLEVLRTCFVDLNIFERNISQSFGIFLVSLITSAFFILTTQLYVFYTLTRVDVSFLSLAYSIAWLVVHFVKIFVLLFLSSRVVHEVLILLTFLCFNKFNIVLFLKKLNVARILHQMRFVGHENEEDILASVFIFLFSFFSNLLLTFVKLQIAQFSLQILHEDRNQMACGILKMDLTLLGTVNSCF